MNNDFIKIPRQHDKAVCECFEKLVKDHETHILNYSIVGQHIASSVNFIEEIPDEYLHIVNLDSSLIRNISANINGFTITYYRGGKENNTSPSPIYDDIVISSNNNTTLPPLKRIEIVNFITNFFEAFIPSRTVGEHPTEEQAQLAAIHQSTLERLERLNEDLIRQSNDFRTNLEKRFEDKISVKELHFSSLEKDLTDQHNAKQASLDAIEETLQHKLKQIDDRDNTHVRRAIRDKMLKDVKDRIDNFGVSSSTENKRRPVQIAILALCITFIFSIYFTVFELSNVSSTTLRTDLASITGIISSDTKITPIIERTIDIDQKNKATSLTKTYWLWGRLAFLTFGLIGSILFYIKWQNKWAEQHSNSEFQLQQFHIDINRANWALESSLEWHKETGTDIPPELLTSLTKNLFTPDSSELENVIHPADELASALIGSSSNLKLNLGGNEVTFDKPSKIPNKASVG